MSVRVFIKRTIPEDKKKEVLPLMIKLRAIATHQPGYICGETLVNANDLEEFVVISTWKDLDTWTAWKTSPQREDIDFQIKDILGNEAGYQSYFSGIL